MGTHPDPSTHGGHHSHSREPRGWRAIPKPALLILAMCLVLLIFAPVIIRTRRSQRNPVKPAEAVTTIPSFQPDLQLRENSFDSTAFVVKGVVVNRSARPYENIQVSYDILDANGTNVGRIVANIPRLGPNESGNFQTNPLPKTGKIYNLRELVGDPR